ncbi:hypothetical protein K9M16_04600 [Candidatus Babeliales bacterium]|nr:hypothetical protein [Candidatus Babeliales bacterium]
MKKILKIITIFLVAATIIGVIFFLKVNNNYSQKQLIISSKLLTNNEFAQNFKRLNYFKNRDTRNKYRAILLKLENPTDKEYILYKNGIDLNIVKPETINKNLKFDDFIAPMVASGLISTSFIFYFGFSYIPSTLAAIAAGTTANNVLSIDKNNNKLKTNIYTKSFDLLHGILIAAHENICTVLFVKKEDVKNSFNLKLINKTDKFVQNFNLSLLISL